MKSIFLCIIFLGCAFNKSQSNLEAAINEQKIWEAALEHKPFISTLSNKENILIDEAYDKASNRAAFRYYFKCMFDFIIVDTAYVKLDHSFREEFWNGIPNQIKNVDLRIPLDKEVLKLNTKAKAVSFSDLSSPEDSDVFTNVQVGTYKLFPYELTIQDSMATLVLDDNYWNNYVFQIDLKSYTVIKYEQVVYDSHRCFDLDYHKLVDFNVSLDSFYNLQYDKVLELRNK